MDYDEEFIKEFNEWYPFERYIIEKPQPIGNLFDDAILLEIFIPETEIKPILDENNSVKYWTKVNDEEIYVKIKGPAGVMRMAYYDFASHIRETIRAIFYEDFGSYEWECFYVDHEDREDLINKLSNQKSLIKQNYGVCNLKKWADSEYSYLLK